MLTVETPVAAAFLYRTRHAATAAGKLAYFDEGTGPAVIMIHGLGGDFTHFEHLAPRFAHDHRVIGIDLPGCGASAKPDGKLSIRACATAVLSLMDELGLSCASLVGHSAGGQVAADAAALAPSRVERLVLVNPSGCRTYPRPLHWLARALFRPALIRATLAPTAGTLMNNVFHAPSERTEAFGRAWASRLREGAAPHTAKVFGDLMPELMSPSVLAHGAKLAMPTMFLWGREDRLVPPPWARDIAAALPDARYEVFEACGHMPIVEQPERTADLLRSFLGQPMSGQRRAAYMASTAD